ncbi:hypothetical protein BaRGS_00005325 [Batillaria attramentaria]|uniref:Uncharacterized protein n=1 Tax=Batillaria attramentaria TaxID=370345 RepID=A0ABD0LUW7_9CAEN
MPAWGECQGKAGRAKPAAGTAKEVQTFRLAAVSGICCQTTIDKTECSEMFQPQGSRDYDVYVAPLLFYIQNKHSVYETTKEGNTVSSFAS